MPCAPVQHSASGTVTGMGGRSGKPVTCCTPANAWAIRSSARSRASGPVCPNGEIRSVHSRGFAASSVPGPSPSASSPVGPRSSTTASARARSAESHGIPPGAARSAHAESFPRFSDWK